MHILLTDSGVGGLSVCALLERYLRQKQASGKIRITYVNASPEDEYGYNSMPTRKEKINTFDRFLVNATEEYHPDFIYIACNTLSVLYKDTDFATNEPVPVLDIIHTGVQHLLEEMKQDPTTIALLFATVTTIDEAMIQRELLQNGIGIERMIRQACPSLADTISEDLGGEQVREKIETYVSQATQSIKDNEMTLLVYLGCTHYGYRKSTFMEVFQKRGYHVKIINPNEGAVADIMGHPSAVCGSEQDEDSVSIEVVSRYRIPERTQKTLAFYLESMSPETVKAINHFTYTPGLF